MGVNHAEMKIMFVMIFLMISPAKFEDYIETEDGPVAIDEVSSSPGKFTFCFLNPSHVIISYLYPCEEITIFTPLKFKSLS
jgi:hypothetical protein